jgi:hypothetical protein
MGTQSHRAKVHWVLVAIAALVAVAGPAAAVDEPIFASGFESGTPGDWSPLTLTIANYSNWCSVNVDLDSASTANPITVTYHVGGTVAALHGEPANASFEWGYWVGTDGTSGHDTNQNATVTMNGDKSVFVCCPFVGGAGCPP